MIRILIIDDDKLTRVGIRENLKNAGITFVGEADNSTAAMQIIAKNPPDIVLLDFYLADLSGLEVCQRIHQKYPAIKIIFITGTHHLATIMRILNTTAAGVVTKDSRFPLSEAIETVSQGETYVQPDIASNLIKFSNQKHQLGKLSNREFEILLGYVRGKTHEQMAEILNVSTKTAINTKLRVLNKVGTKDIAKLHYLLFSDTTPVSLQ